MCGVSLIGGGYEDGAVTGFGAERWWALTELMWEGAGAAGAGSLLPCARQGSHSSKKLLRRIWSGLRQDRPQALGFPEAELNKCSEWAARLKESFGEAFVALRRFAGALEKDHDILRKNIASRLQGGEWIDAAALGRELYRHLWWRFSFGRGKKRACFI